jgi:FkbM family methyltransferase
MRNDLEQLTSMIASYFTPNAFLEVGSRDGLDTKYVCKYWNLNHENAFIIEANIFCYQKIASDMVIGGNKPYAKVLYGAASNYDGEVKFNCVTSDNQELVGISSIKKSKVVNLNYKQNIVPCFKIDKIVKENNIDLIKIDVEGHGFEVLQGLSDAIDNVKAIQIETESIELFENQTLDDQIHNFMLNKGFELINKQPCWDLQFDCLYINKNLKK